MNTGCPNQNCKIYLQNVFQKKDGHYFRADDSRYIQRFKCKICGKKYSASTHKLEYRQKKRRFNQRIKEDYVGGKSMNRMSLNLGLHPKTIHRKIEYLARKARQSQRELHKKLRENKTLDVQFDDLITSVHTKLKPVSVSVVINPADRYILGAVVSEIPAFGKIAEISRRKYGRRKNNHTKNLDLLLEKLKPLIHPNAEFKTDEHKRYPELIHKHYPKSTHFKYKGERAAVAGFGELKSKRFDPLFGINQILAMFRANINRLFRRSWNTTKKENHLQDHLDIFMDYFNEVLRNQSRKVRNKNKVILKS